MLNNSIFANTRQPETTEYDAFNMTSASSLLAIVGFSIMFFVGLVLLGWIYKEGRNDNNKDPLTCSNCC